MARYRGPNYAVRRLVLLLVVALAVVVGASRGWDYLFPPPLTTHEVHR